jgi:hypothetical protein
MRSQCIGLLGAGGGDFSRDLHRSATTVKATQKAIDKQHAEVFTPDVVAGLTDAAKAHYVKVITAGIDGFKNTYPSAVQA